MYNIAFEELDYNAVYLPFAMKRLRGLKHSLNQFNIQGLSITIPHKIKIRRVLNKIDPLALKIGSVNTLKRNKAELLEGYNTDGTGAVRAINASGFNLRNKKILVIGSGGSARSIIFAILQNSISEIGILARNQIKAKILKESILLNRPRTDVRIILMPNPKKKFWKGKKVTILKSSEQIEKYDLIINTTPLGMKHYAEGSSPLSENMLSKHQRIFDIVYNPQDTQMLKFAKRLKLDFIYGYKMLLYQGVEQFQIFTGLEAPEPVMERVLLQNLNKT